MQELVKCKECGKEMKWIQNRHLALHGMTREDYKAKYPGSPLKSESMTKKLSDTRGNKAEPNTRVCAREDCTNITTTSRNKYCSYSCASKVRADMDSNPFKSKNTNPNYKDGVHSSWKRLSRKVFKLDNKTCQCCGKELKLGDKYGIHHIIPKKVFTTREEADVIANVITLCGSCHHEVEYETTSWIFELYRNRNIMSDLEIMKLFREKIISRRNK